MNRTLLAIPFLFLSAAVGFSAEENVKAAAAPAPAVESEKAKDWKGLQAQEQWVTRLKKQVEGETKQLTEMRSRTAGKYKLDPKKFDEGGYFYDEKTDSFVER